MIKIKIIDVEPLREEYYQLLKYVVAARLTNFNTALNIVLSKGAKIGKTVDVTIRATTKMILSMMLEEKVDHRKFKGNKFGPAVKKYSAIAMAAKGKDFAKLISFSSSLSDTKNGKLKFLLTCPPEQLEYHNLDLINSFGGGDLQLKLLAIPFNYEANGEINALIKNFFRIKNFVKYCPYCNQDPAMYSGLSNKRTVRVHQLDHFYDKATKPLLCYSLFNLVPGDWNCNSINKGQKPFTFDGHLNPYLEGFGADMRFSADNIGTLRPLTQIILNIPKSVNPKKRKRLIGDNKDINEEDSIGNINVFGLKQKYNDSHVISEADKVQRLFIDNGNNLGSLKDLLSKLPVRDIHDRYINWYELAVRAPFTEADFNDQRYSKLFRDLHDDFFNNDEQPHNEVIREVIKLL